MSGPRSRRRARTARPAAARLAVLSAALCAALLSTPSFAHEHEGARQGAAAAAPWRAVVLATIQVLPPPEKGRKRLELSGLGWNPRTGELLAVSDRGQAGVVDLDLAQPLPARAGWRSWQGLPPGLPRNAEALAWRPTAEGGEWLLATEPSPGAFRVAAGAPLGSPAAAPLSWPPGLAAHLARGGRHGVEALAWHPLHGLLAAAQRPDGPALDGAPPQHAVHAESGSWRFAAHGDQSHLKAIEVLPDGTLLLLERTRQEGSADFQTHLRWIDLRTCGGPAVCAAPAVAFSLPLRAGAINDEGLACTPALRCWIVNDDGAAAVPGTRLLQFELVRRPPG